MQNKNEIIIKGAKLRFSGSIGNSLFRLIFVFAEYELLYKIVYT